MPNENLIRKPSWKDPDLRKRLAAQLNEPQMPRPEPWTEEPSDNFDNYVYMARISLANKQSVGGFQWPDQGYIECPDWDDEDAPLPGLYGYLHGYGSWHMPALVFQYGGSLQLLVVDKREVLKSGSVGYDHECRVRRAWVKYNSTFDDVFLKLDAEGGEYPRVVGKNFADAMFRIAQPHCGVGRLNPPPVRTDWELSIRNISPDAHRNPQALMALFDIEIP